MDDEAQDDARRDTPGGPPGDDTAMPAAEVPHSSAARGPNWERRLAEARAEREQVLSRRVAAGGPAEPLIARRPFGGEGGGADLPSVAAPVPDPLVGRPKPWETGAGAPREMAGGPAGAPTPPPAQPATAEVAARPVPAPQAAPPITDPPPAPAAGARSRIASGGLVAAGILLGLAAGLAGGLAIDRFADPNAAEAGAPRTASSGAASPVPPSAPGGTDAEADDRPSVPGGEGEDAGDDEGDGADDGAGYRPGGSGAPARDAGTGLASIVPDAPQPRAAAAPAAMRVEPKAVPDAALPAGPERRLEAAGGLRMAAPLSGPAAADREPVLAVRFAEISPRLFFGDADRAAAAPASPLDAEQAPVMPLQAAAFARPSALAAMGPFDAADAAPWVLTRAPGMPRRTAMPLAPVTVAFDPAGDVADLRLRADPGTRGAGRPAEIAGNSETDPAPLAEASAAPRPVPGLVPGAGPALGPSPEPASGPAPTSAVAAAAPMAVSAPALFTPEAEAPPGADAPPPGTSATGQADIRLSGGSAADRERIAAEGIAFAAAPDDPFPFVRREVRFFHPGDEALAAALAARLEAELRDFSSFRPAPPEGRIEIRLPGE